MSQFTERFHAAFDRYGANPVVMFAQSVGAVIVGCRSIVEVAEPLMHHEAPATGNVVVFTGCLVGTLALSAGAFASRSHSEHVSQWWKQR